MTEEPPSADNPLHDLTVENAQELPAIFSNRFHITVDPAHTRILFGQKFMPQEQARSQSIVVLPTTEAVELANLILQLVDKAGGSPDMPEDSSAD